MATAIQLMPARGWVASYAATRPACFVRNGSSPAGPPTATTSGTNQSSETAVKTASTTPILRQPASASATASIGSTARHSCGRQPMAAEAKAPRASAAGSVRRSINRPAAASARDRNIRAGESDRASGP
jgi:hypothetical protein